MKSSAKYIVMIDVETGGLPNSNLKAFLDVALIELAAVVIDLESLSIIEEKSWIFEEYKSDLIYNKEAEMVHGISKEIINSKGEPSKKILKEFKSMLTKYKNPRHKAILGGHNISGFDIFFLEEFFSFEKENLYEYVKWIEDTQKLAYYSKLEQPDYKLGTCCNLNEIDLVESHRALEDTKANAYLMIKYLERLRGLGNFEIQEENEIVEERFRSGFEL